MESQKEERKRKGRLFKAVMVENSPVLGREMNTQIHENQRKPNRKEPKKGYTETHYN